MLGSLWRRPKPRRPAPARRLSLEQFEERAVPTVVAVNDTYTVQAGSVLTVPVTEGVLANDFSLTSPGNVLTAKLLVPPTFVNPAGVPLPPTSLTLQPNGEFTFVAPSNVPQGTVQFVYQAIDPIGPPPGDNDVATVTIDIRAAPVHYFVTGADAGGGSHVRVFDSATGLERFSFLAFDPSFTGGVRVAAGDLNNDGVDEIVVGAGPGGGPAVNVYDGQSGGLLASFFAYEPAFQGGVYVAVGDIDGNGNNEIITGAGNGGGADVRVFHGQNILGSTVAFPSPLFNFLAFEPSFRGGVTVAAGDITGLGRDAIIIGAGPGGGPRVRAFDGIGVRPLLDFFAFDPAQRGGVNVAAGDFGRGTFDIVAGSGSGLPVVSVFSGQTAALLRTFQAFPQDLPTGGVFLGGPTAQTVPFAGPNLSLLPPAGVPSSLLPTIGSFPSSVSQFTLGGFAGAGGGVRVAVTDRTGDGVADIVTGPGPGFSPRVRIFDGTDLTEVTNITAYNPNFLGGVFVGGGD